MADDVITSSVDLRRMVQEAQAAGFNPLTVLRSGAAAGFATQRNQYGVVGGGTFTADQTAPVAQALPAPMAVDPSWTIGQQQAYAAFAPQMDASGLMPGQPGYDPPHRSAHESSGGEWEAESEFNIALAQLRMRSADVITDDGVRIPTRPARSVPQAGGMLNPVSYTGGQGVVSAPAGAAARQSVIGANGFQPFQVYQADKIPNVITGDTTHYILPGIPWKEGGGTSRGETWETVYGEDSPATALMSWPKFGRDAVQNILDGVVFAWGELSITKIPEEEDRGWMPRISYQP